MENFLTPMSLSPTALANTIGVPPRRINEIVLGKRSITTDTNLRLGSRAISECPRAFSSARKPTTN
jgi:addiction module HigA family antidote